MKYQIESGIIELVSQMRTGVIIVRGAYLPSRSEQIEELLAEQEGWIQREFAGQDVKSIPAVSAWRKAFEAVGQSARVFPCSLESSLRRLIGGKKMPRINPLVDWYNAMTLKYLIPMGAYDLSCINGDQIGLKRASGVERYVPLGGGDVQRVPAGEIIFASGEEALCRAWTWRQNDTSKIGPETSDFLLRIESIGGAGDNLDQMITEASQFITSQLAGRVESFILDSSHPVLDIGASAMAAVSPESQKLIDRFFERGIDTVYPSEKAFRQALSTGKRMRFYLGADPSRPDLHIGHAVVLRRMRVLQDLGHEIIFLIGDFTGRIGDPTGKDQTRVQMTSEDVMKNAETYKEQITKIFDFSGPNPAKILFNSTWNEKLTFTDVINLAAKFTVQQMIERDMYQNRLKAGIPIYLHEFFYPLMQGYDSVAMDVDGEFGGTDQMFNMMAGRTLLKEMKNKEKFVITGRLLVGSDGRKMSKSYDNYIAINDEPNDMYGKVMSIRDDLIAVYMELCTDIPLAEVKKAAAEVAAQTVNPRDHKMRLAREIVTIYHTESIAQQAEDAFINQFRKGGLPKDIPEKQVSTGIVKLSQLLVDLGLSPSSSEAKRLISFGAVKVNGAKVAPDISQMVDLAASDGAVIQAGKLHFVKIRLTS